MKIWYFTLPSVAKKQSWFEVYCGYMNAGLIGVIIGAAIGVMWLLIS